MDRRQFARLAVAVFAGQAIAELAAGSPLLLEDARTNEFDVSQEFDNATWARPGTFGLEGFDGKRWVPIATEPYAGGFVHVSFGRRFSHVRTVFHNGGTHA